MRFSTTIDIEAVPDRVWTVVCDVERWPEWTPSVTHIERLDAGPLAVGSRARVRQPRLAPAVWEVTALDEGRSFTWVTRAPGVLVSAYHGVAPRADGARATLTLEMSGPFGSLLAWLLRGLNRRYLGLEAQGLKRRSEEQPQ